MPGQHFLTPVPTTSDALLLALRYAAGNGDIRAFSAGLRVWGSPES